MSEKPKLVEDSLRTMISKVEEFHEAFGLIETQNYAKNPHCCTLRRELMREENNEYMQACAANDDVAIADAIGDMLYILLGTALAHGLEDKLVEVFNEIHRSNMSKLEDGKPIYREDGKVMKGKDYFKPNIKQILENGRINQKTGNIEQGRESSESNK